jgi:hypothetical protein
MGALFETLLSATYHTAKLRAEAERRAEYGGGEPKVAFKSWHARLERLGEEGPILSRVLSPGAATEALHAHYEDLSNLEPKYRNYDSLARHATAAWAHHHWLDQRLHGNGDKDVGGHLKGLTKKGPLREMVGETLGTHITNKVLKPSNEDLTYEGIGKAYSETLASGHHRPGIKFGKFDILEAGVDNLNVSRFRARLSYFDPEATVAKVARATDPRAWSQHFPDLFLSSYRIRPPTQHNCQNRYMDPDPWIGLDPPSKASTARLKKGLSKRAADLALGRREKSRNTKDPTAPGEPWDGYLFEHAQTNMGALAVVSGRNILRMKFTVTQPDESKPREGSVTIGFSIHEPLTSSVLWFVSAGGPDVDRHPDGGPLSVELHGDSQGSVTSTSGKYVRYPPQVYFAEELNAIALPLWMVAITSGLFQAAGYDVSTTDNGEEED